MTPLPSTLREGVFGGLVFGGVFTVAAALILAFRGSDVAGGFWLPLVQVGGTYLLGGAVGGALLFWLRPILKRRFGSAIVGIIVFLPVALLIALTVDADNSLADRIVAGLVVAILFGSVIGTTQLREN